MVAHFLKKNSLSRLSSCQCNCQLKTIEAMLANDHFLCYFSARSQSCSCKWYHHWLSSCWRLSQDDPHPYFVLIPFIWRNTINSCSLWIVYFWEINRTKAQTQKTTGGCWRWWWKAKSRAGDEDEKGCNNVWLKASGWLKHEFIACHITSHILAQHCRWVFISRIWLSIRQLWSSLKMNTGLAKRLAGRQWWM